jgi:hypothetical protein
MLVRRRWRKEINVRLENRTAVVQPLATMFPASFTESYIYNELCDVAQKRHTIKWTNCLQQFGLRHPTKAGRGYLRIS